MPSPSETLPDYPDAYLRGTVDFFYLPFKTDPRALIPRLETESLVRRAISLVRQERFGSVVDVGTGSGIIAVSLAKNLPGVPVSAIDVSSEALSLARENALRNGVRVDFFESDLLSAWSDAEFPARESVLFVANLPYVRDGDPDVSPDTVHEPASALYGGPETGFELTARFLSELESLRFAAGVRWAAVCEVGDDHEAVAAEFAASRGAEIEFFADLRGIRRFFTYRPWSFGK